MKIISTVNDTRNIVYDKWKTPNASQSILWAFSELGELSEVLVALQQEWARNNAPKVYDPPEKEFAQFLIMLATATLHERQNGEAGFDHASFILSIILDVEYSKINAPYELLLRSVKYGKKYFPSFNAYDLVRLECDRIIAKYS